ncbi:MAG TPA: hypothetical protein PLW75_11680 [Hyphomicrobium sp.]|nr:hypothetical protein [Hyphomicrobium sp.]
MSEAQVAVTDRWTDGRRVPGKSRGPRAAPRSLKDALSEAGLAPESDLVSHSDPRDVPWTALRQRKPLTSLALQLEQSRVEEPASPFAGDAPSQPAVQRVAAADEASPALASSSWGETPRHGVVSPPPWVRAARRGRWHARFMNAFGWLVTIVVVGSIITLAGRYLAVPPTAESIYTARQ